jgi:hypothetical protein
MSEGFGAIMNNPHRATINQAYFNYFEIPVEFLFFFWLFYKAFQHLKSRIVPIVCAVLYIGCWLFDVTYFNRGAFFFYSSYTIGILLMLVVVLMFFIRLGTSDDILTFRQNMLFWISVGMLFYYLGSLPFYALRNVMSYKFQSLYNHYAIIVEALNSFMYLMFTVSFIWGKPNTTS